MTALTRYSEKVETIQGTVGSVTNHGHIMTVMVSEKPHK